MERTDYKAKYRWPSERRRGEVALRYDNEEFYGPCMVLYREHDRVRVGWIIDFEPPWEEWAQSLFGDRPRYVAMCVDGQSRTFDSLEGAEDWLVPIVEAIVERLNAKAPAGQQEA